MFRKVKAFSLLLMVAALVSSCDRPGFVYDKDSDKKVSKERIVKKTDEGAEVIETPRAIVDTPRPEITPAVEAPIVQGGPDIILGDEEFLDLSEDSGVKKPSDDEDIVFNERPVLSFDPNKEQEEREEEIILVEREKKEVVVVEEKIIEPISEKEGPSISYNKNKVGCYALNKDSIYEDIDYGVEVTVNIMSSSKNKSKNIDNFFSEEARMLDEVLYTSTIETKERSYKKGLILDNGKNISNPFLGKDLTEWYGLNYRGQIVAPSASEEGYYLFATLADDGTRLYFGDSLYPHLDRSETTLGGSRFTCPTDINKDDRYDVELIKITKSNPLPFELQYFQGPRYVVANTLYWKKVADLDATSLDTKASKLCGKAPALFKTSTRRIQAKGWSVVPASALRMPKGSYNPCVK